jgi:hypothetical protein
MMDIETASNKLPERLYKDLFIRADIPDGTSLIRDQN